MDRVELDKIHFIMIRWEMKGKQVYFLLLNRDGTITRMGDGHSGDNFYFGFDTGMDCFHKVLSLFEPAELDPGIYDLTGRKGTVCDIELLLHYNEKEATGYKVIYGSESGGVPGEIQRILRGSMEITDPWWIRQKQNERAGKPETKTKKWFEFWK